MRGVASRTDVVQCPPRDPVAQEHRFLDVVRNEHDRLPHAGLQSQLGGPPECAQRPFCKPGLEQTYGMKFTGFPALGAGGPLTKTAIKQGRIQIGLVFSSDGELSTVGWVECTGQRSQPMVLDGGKPRSVR
jgi:hypothetical protein